MIPDWLLKAIAKARVKGNYCDTTCPYLTPVKGWCNMEKDGGNCPEVLETSKDPLVMGMFKRCGLCLEVEKLSRGV